MLTAKVSPVFKVKDYTLTLTPKSDFLSLEGEYQIEGDFIFPDNFLELSYKFPSQTIDKLFLKKQDRGCPSTNIFSNCWVYRNTALIDTKNDPFFSSFRENPVSADFQTYFSINSNLFSRRLDNYPSKEALLELQQVISKASLRNSFEFNNKHLVNFDSMNRRKGDYFTLNLLNKVVIQKGKKNIYDYDTIALYSPSWGELIEGTSPVYLWSLGSEGFFPSSIQAKLEFSSNQDSRSPKTLTLDNLDWSRSLARAALFQLELESNREIPDFSKIDGLKLQSDFSVTKNGSVNYIRTKSSFLERRKTIKPFERESVFINPQDPLLEDAFPDHNWIMEEL